MYDSHYEWSQKAQQWVEDLAADPADLLSPGRTFEVLNNAATLASIGHDDLAGTVLRAWNAAVSRRTTADASARLGLDDADVPVELAMSRRWTA